jgi:hypothetical protein
LLSHLTVDLSLLPFGVSGGAVTSRCCSVVLGGGTVSGRPLPVTRSCRAVVVFPGTFLLRTIQYVGQLVLQRVDLASCDLQIHLRLLHDPAQSLRLDGDDVGGRSFSIGRPIERGPVSLSLPLVIARDLVRRAVVVTLGPGLLVASPGHGVPPGGGAISAGSGIVTRRRAVVAI